MKMGIKKLVDQYSTVNKLLFPNMSNKMRLHYAKFYDVKPINNNMILYETRDGKSIVDSPYAIFLYLAKTPEFNHFQHVWVLDKKDEGVENSIPAELRSKVTFVYRQTLKYVDAILEAKYLISNSTFESFFVKRPGQIYINTWHGTPLKLMGFDIPEDISHSKNVLRNFLMTDYLFSPNEHTSNIFINSYKLKGIYPGEILEAGYPRIDLTLNADKEKIYQKITKDNCKIRSDKPIILYTPTWKGQSVHNVNDDLEQIVLETLTLVQEFKTNYQVLLKVHPFIYSDIKEDKRISPYLVSDLIDANEVLAVTDLLITDYSSIFFDFLVTGKPIIFYAWDKDLYRAERGLYLTEQELPGPIAENINELISLVHMSSINHKNYYKKYKDLQEKFTGYDDGNVTKRYVDYIFKSIKTNEITIHKVDSEKKKILFFPGGMRNNGITSSFLNLLNNINYNEYDVTVILNSNNNKEINNNLKLMNSNVRPLFRFGIDILTQQEKIINKKFTEKGVPFDRRDKYPVKGYSRESRRLTSNLKFDVAIDFSGYSYFWGRHILGVDADKYLVFMHNDLSADSMREINGKRPMFKDLNGLFSIYYKFDRILSVSPMTRDVNLEKLSQYVDKEQMSFVYNTINVENIINPVKVDKTINPLLIERRLLRATNDSDIKVYKNFDSIEKEQFYRFFVNKDSQVVQYASYEFKGQIFIKITINGTYLGWTDQANFSDRKTIIYSIDDFHGYGTVSRLFSSVVRKDIVMSEEENEIITYIKPFKHRYVEIEKVANTSNGYYYFIKYNGKKLGWAIARSIQRVHKVKRMSPLNLYFQTKIAEREKDNPVKYPNKVEWTLRYGKLNDFQKTAFFSEPEGVTGGLELSVSEEYSNQIFMIKEITEFNGERYCRLSLLDGSFIGHVNENDIIYQNDFEPNEISDESESKDDGLPKMDINNQPLPDFDSDYLNFVNMGRLSPEKNQKTLIIAFSRFLVDNPKARLYILGKGPLENELKEQIRELNVENSVFLLGHISTPYHFMKQTDCFVLPSLYEGQPMVLLEALTLGMKILASNIPANINVVGADEKYGLLTKGTEVEDIYQGLLRMSHNRKIFDVFDYREYNKQAIDSFYGEIN